MAASLLIICIVSCLASVRMSRHSYLNIALVVLFVGFALLFFALTYDSLALAIAGLIPLIIGFLILVTKVIANYEFVRKIWDKRRKK